MTENTGEYTPEQKDIAKEFSTPTLWYSKVQMVKDGVENIWVRKTAAELNTDLFAANPYYFTDPLPLYDGQEVFIKPAVLEEVANLRKRLLKQRRELKRLNREVANKSTGITEYYRDKFYATKPGLDVLYDILGREEYMKLLNKDYSAELSGILYELVLDKLQIKVNREAVQEELKKRSWKNKWPFRIFF